MSLCVVQIFGLSVFRTAQKKVPSSYSWECANNKCHIKPAVMLSGNTDRTSNALWDGGRSHTLQSCVQVITCPSPHGDNPSSSSEAAALSHSSRSQGTKSTMLVKMDHDSWASALLLCAVG